MDQDTVVERDYDFDAVGQHVCQYFAVFSGQHLFQVRLEPNEDLFDLFLNALPPEHRQSHNCNCCRSFVRRYGGLVTINQDGAVESAMWGPAAPTIYKDAVLKLRNRVCAGEVQCEYVDDKTTWGTPQTGAWSHFAVEVSKLTPPCCVAFGKTAGQTRAMLREQYRTLAVAINTTWSLRTLETGLALLRSGTLYRGDRFVQQAEFLAQVKRDQNTINSSRLRKNVLWRALSTAPAGWATPRSTALGALLDDVEAGLPSDQIKRKFDAMLAPENFRRVQVAPTASALQQAERLVEQMGLAPALTRRYARLEELPCIWTPKAIELGRVQKNSTGVFGSLTPRGAAAPQTPDMKLPPATVTWDKFRRTVLPDARRLELVVPPSTARFAALVTAVDPAAPPLLLWDRPEARNPFSWYYGAGADGEMRRRVVEAGGQYDEVDLRVSLMWNDRNDLDLHCQTPGGSHIYYGYKRDMTGGYLDVDMNVSGETTKPVENIRWPLSRAQPGRYLFSVWNYRHHEYPASDVEFTLELAVGGKTYVTRGTVPLASIKTRQVVAEVEYRGARGELSSVILHGVPVEQKVGALGTNSWGLVPGALVPVTGVVESPNLWGDAPVTSAGRHVFLLLEGCSDAAPTAARGFFNEHLRGELRPARQALEAYAAQAGVAGAEDATACGLGYTDQAPWDVMIRAHLPSGPRDYKIDRWD